MKRKISIAVSVFAFFLVFNISESNAQSNVGGFLAYGTGVESIGIGAVGEFYVTDEISILPSMIFFFPDGFNWFEINANGAYHFTTGGSARPYGLAGLNFAFLSANGGGGSASEIGLNIGIGSDFDIGSNIVPFGEIRFVVGNADQLVLSGGVKFGI